MDNIEIQLKNIYEEIAGPSSWDSFFNRVLQQYDPRSLGKEKFVAGVVDWFAQNHAVIPKSANYRHQFIDMQDVLLDANPTDLDDFYSECRDKAPGHCSAMRM